MFMFNETTLLRPVSIINHNKTGFKRPDYDHEATTFGNMKDRNLRRKNKIMTRGKIRRENLLEILRKNRQVPNKKANIIKNQNNNIIEQFKNELMVDVKAEDPSMTKGKRMS
eukprot:UN27711